MGDPVPGITKYSPQQFEGRNLKEIILLGKARKSTFMDYITNSSKFKIRRLNKIEAANKVIDKTNPDFVLCSGRIRVDADGNYYLEI
jgi:hypothetical protein